MYSDIVDSVWVPTYWVTNTPPAQYNVLLESVLDALERYMTTPNIMLEFKGMRTVLQYSEEDGYKPMWMFSIQENDQ